MPVNSFENYPMSWKPKKTDLEKPYYLSIAARLEKDIFSGLLPENTKLPPQRELADFLDLNLSTITKAYKLCELKGLLYAVTGKGTFVSPRVSVQDTFLDKNSTVIEMGMIKPFYECNQSVLSAAKNVLNTPDNIRLLNTAILSEQNGRLKPLENGFIILVSTQQKKISYYRLAHKTLYLLC